MTDELTTPPTTHQVLVVLATKPLTREAIRAMGDDLSAAVAAVELPCSCPACLIAASSEALFSIIKGIAEMAEQYEAAPDAVKSSVPFPFGPVVHRN
jgi:hypothetical protein